MQTRNTQIWRYSVLNNLYIRGFILKKNNVEKEASAYPKISVITCVYNGEKYISKLLDSVLNMGYPNIEHIIINDGSTDSTEQIVMKYAKLYENKEDTNLYIKCINQKNTGLGGATNAGLREITGKYWTWINCDDWYEPQAFNKVIAFLENNKQYSYVQLNGYRYKNGATKLIIKDEKKFSFYNKKKLICQFARKNNFKYMLYICRVSDYKRICPSLSIYPSRFTQDEQLIAQIFGTLNGSFFKEPVWNFTIRGDSYNLQHLDEHTKESQLMQIKSVELLDVNEKLKRTLKHILSKPFYVQKMAFHAKRHERKECLLNYREYLKSRKSTYLSYRLHYPDHIFLYLIYAFLSK